ncbi:hypothetical protein E2C01_060960 [Portunus trituberculatus]|uniref:FAD dependent oxidoreductase domain-containing protein n=1 Tax=Portunus trituberculatus TaxID=210409 RepID=A0A5B7HBY2_PORTR|nr:hypothetical protein [Portunus trituberculatus]
MFLIFSYFSSFVYFQLFISLFTYSCIFFPFLLFSRAGSGTSHNGSGVLGLFKPSSEREIVTYSVNLIKALQEDGHNLGLRQCGSLNLARTRDRAIAMKRRIAYTKPSGLECEYLSQFFQIVDTVDLGTPICSAMTL